jgi:histidinol-phosphate aminotransferase
VRPRPELEHLPPAFHGGAPPVVGPVLDFSVCSNPLGASPRVRTAARAATVERYPEREAAGLRVALAERLGLSPERVVVGNGSAELFWLLALCFLERGDRACVVGPAFAEYARAARLMGAEVVEYHSDADADFRVDLADLTRTLVRLRPCLTFVCNPNNPTGGYLRQADVQALLASTPGILVLDEAYVNFVDSAWDARVLLADERVVVVRSMTKDHALAGLRLGYALGDPSVIRALQHAQPPWSVNAAAQAAGLAALGEDDHVARGRAVAQEATHLLARGLRAHGYRVLPWAANFILAEVGSAATLTASLLDRGVYLRDCTSFGLPGHVRVAARPLAQCDALLDALSALTGVQASDRRTLSSGVAT